MTTSDEREEELQVILTRPYHKLIRGDAHDGFLAEVLELPGCVTAGVTEEEALANLREAMAGWVESALIAGDPIPEPASGRVTVAS